MTANNELLYIWHIFHCHLKFLFTMYLKKHYCNAMEKIKIQNQIHLWSPVAMWRGSDDLLWAPPITNV